MASILASASVKNEKITRTEYNRAYHNKKYKENREELNKTRLINRYNQYSGISKDKLNDYSYDEYILFCKTKIYLDKLKKTNINIYNDIIDFTFNNK
jgi:hypothetical protein